MFSEFTPITLPQLTSQAGLMTRFDRKYVVPTPLVHEVLSHLSPNTQVLMMQGQTTFSYQSVYFDTPTFLSHFLSARRRRRTFKVRTRTYVDSVTSFLEVKTKDGRGRTVKERMGYAPEDQARLTAAGMGFVATKLRGLGLGSDLVEGLQPVLGTRYDRATLLLEDGSRATVDFDLGWFLPQDASWVGGLGGFAIVESKSSGHRNVLDRLLWRRGQRPVSISKFGTGLVAFHPALSHNKWARVLKHVVVYNTRSVSSFE